MRPNVKSSWLRGSLVMLTLFPLPVLAQEPPAKPWKLTWSDEFNAKDGRGPDPAKWKIITGGTGWSHNELEYYTARPENLRQEKGNLVIEARQEEYTGPDHVTKTATSGRLITLDRFAQKYGRFEARMKLPAGKGLWPAFWLMGDNHDTIGWPDCGEIDVMENIGDPHRIYGTLHGPGYSGAKGIQKIYTFPAGQSVDSGFHIYAVEWGPHEVRIFLDDQMYADFTEANLPPGKPWVFDRPFYILLNFAVGGSWPGYPDASTKFPQQVLVDYVRAYKR